MAYDYIIVGGGSAGSVMANRLSARSANQVLLCEAGQDTPEGNVPPEILNSYPGTAYFDPRFHWQELKVHTQIVPHNRPDERPPLRKYEQARVLGGGSSINGQLANRGAPTDYDEWEAKGAEGWNWNAGAALFQEGRARHGFRRPVSRQGWPHPGAPHLPRYVVRPRQGGRGGPQGSRVRLYRGPERRIPRRLFPDHDLEPRRPPRLGRDRLSRPRDTAPPEPDDLGRDAGHGAVVRGHPVRRGQGAGQGKRDRVPRRSQPRRGHRLVGRDPFAGASAARRDRPGSGAEGSRDRGARAPARRRPAADGPPVGFGVVLHEKAGAAQRADPQAHPAGAALFVGDRGRRAGRHVRRGGQQIGVARGRRADRLEAGLRLQDPVRDRAGPAFLARLAGRAGCRVQPVVRPARPRPADGRVPPFRQTAHARARCARRSATRSRPATATGCARSASSTTRTGG